MAKKYRVAVIAGDGIGREVVPEGIAVMEAAARRYGFALEWREFDWSCETYDKTGHMMPVRGLAVGAVDPAAPRLSAIHQSAAGAAAGRGRLAAQEPRAGRHRFLCRA